MAVIDGFTINGTDFDLRDNSKVSNQQGSGNAGKALIVGNDGNVMLGEAGIPDAVKTTLLQLLQHVTYSDERGPAYLEALSAALDGEIPPEPPEPDYDYYWDYTMGLLTENGYTLSADNGTDEIVSDGMLIRIYDKNWEKTRTYRNNDLRQNACKMECEFLYHHTSPVIALTDGTKGARIRITSSANSGGYYAPLAIYVYEGNDEVVVNGVQVSENVNHTIGLEYNNGTKLTLDGTVIYDTDKVSTYYMSNCFISVFSEAVTGDTIDDCWFKLKSIKYWRI